jgi:MHS family proline/betaine transporter-like MFS transporter
MTGTDAAAPTSTLRRVIAASGLGTLIEYFDYASYSYLATTIAVAFFPSEDRTTALLNTFAVFAVSFLCRPIGALVWGRLGDRLGRKRILATTILIMSGATCAVGLIPSHATIGVAAPALLLLLRMTQSFSAAGEYAGATTFVAEYSPTRSRGLMSSVVPIAAAAGFLLASLAATLLYHLVSTDAMNSWGWRIPFLIAGPLGVVGLYLRYRLEETPEFKKLLEHEQEDPAPVRSGLRTMLRPMGLLLMIMALNAGGYYVLLGYTPTYLVEETGMTQADATLAITIANAIYLFFLPGAAALSDRFGRRHTLLAAGVLLLVLSYPLVALLSVDGFLLTTVVLTGLLAVFSLNDGVFPAFFAESFGTRTRYTGFALTFNVGAVLFGGISPYVATWLIARTGNPQAPAFYLMGLALLSIIATLIVRETARRPLQEATTPAADAQITSK